MADEDLSKLKIDKSSAIKGPVKNRKRTAYAIGVAAAVILIGVLFFSGVISPSIKVQEATVSLVYPSQTFTLLNASGYVVAQRKAALASKVTGRIIQLNVEEGSKVRKGDIIARLENNDVTAARDQAAANVRVSRANLESAQATFRDASLAFKRNKDLIGKGYIAQSDYDTSEARYKSAEAAVHAADQAAKAAAAALSGANVAIDYTVLRSPFDAVVLTKNADIGDIVTPIGATANVQSAVVTIADMNSLLAEVDVSESNIGNVKMAQPCEIQLDALPGVRFKGQVHMIVPTADRSKATVMVKVRFLEKDSRILPEMSAKVAFLSREVAAGETEPFTAVNQSALVARNGKKIIFLAEGEKAKAVMVTTGRQMGDMVEILSGAKAGDKVVLRPSGDLRDGSKIKAEEK
ncbi:MAG TPA: efflux RND transporter periplasmic adaptor subunit [Dissulfurispiraceae bacterium]|nr:efflux RND transporter periplasmic adaptor subunit [Dissulfurispiraceae bacterium]